MSPFLVMLQTSFYLKRTQTKIEHSKDTLRLLKGQAKGNRMALGQTRHSRTSALKTVEALCLADSFFPSERNVR